MGLGPRLNENRAMTNSWCPPGLLGGSTGWSGGRTGRHEPTAPGQGKTVDRAEYASSRQSRDQGNLLAQQSNLPPPPTDTEPNHGLNLVN